MFITAQVIFEREQQIESSIMAGQNSSIDISTFRN